MRKYPSGASLDVANTWTAAQTIASGIGIRRTRGPDELGRTDGDD